MAITNTTYPSAMHAAFSPVIYRCTSTNSAETNFQMSVDVIVNTVVIASKFVRYNSYSEFDISEILQAEILSHDDGHDIITGSFGVQSPVTQNSVVNYSLTFCEWYDDANGLLIEGDTLTVSTIGGATIYGYNFALQDSVFNSQTFTDYVLSGVTSKFLTNSINYLSTGEKLSISFLYSGALQLKCYWESYINGTLSSSGNSALVTISNKRGILLIDNTHFLSNITEVRYQIKTSAGTAISKQISIYKNKVPCQYRLEFKNLLGGMDAYSFREAESSIKTSRDLQNINGVYKTLSTNPNSEIQLTGKYENDNVLEWLEEMHLSRVVYLTDNVNRERVEVVSSGDVTQSRDMQLPAISIRLKDKILN